MYKEKIQLEVCKAILNGKRVVRMDINENETAVTIDGVKLFVFFNNEIVFDKSKIPAASFANVLKVDEKDVEITETNRMLYQNRKTLREYKNEEAGLSVYLDKGNAEAFKGCKFYAYAQTGRVLVKDDFGNVNGVVMPVRVFEGV